MGAWIIHAGPLESFAKLHFERLYRVTDLQLEALQNQRPRIFLLKALCQRHHLCQDIASFASKHILITKAIEWLTAQSLFDGTRDKLKNQISWIFFQPFGEWYPNWRYQRCKKEMSQTRLLWIQYVCAMLRRSLIIFRELDRRSSSKERALQGPIQILWKKENRKCARLSKAGGQQWKKGCALFKWKVIYFPKHEVWTWPRATLTHIWLTFFSRDTIFSAPLCLIIRYWMLKEGSRNGLLRLRYVLYVVTRKYPCCHCLEFCAVILFFLVSPFQNEEQQWRTLHIWKWILQFVEGKAQYYLKGTSTLVFREDSWLSHSHCQVVMSGHKSRDREGSFTL